MDHGPTAVHLQYLCARLHTARLGEGEGRGALGMAIADRMVAGRSHELIRWPRLEKASSDPFRPSLLHTGRYAAHGSALPVAPPAPSTFTRYSVIVNT